MRLLKTSTITSETHTLQLVEFVGRKIPAYAILSHTWAEDEVLFEDIVPAVSSSARKKAAFSKIKHAAEQAIKDGFEYLWIDTCCINRTSSAELQEAINSMFRWYQSADVCYVYFSDVGKSIEHLVSDQEIKSSRWFRRGWTLQELLAPRKLNFYTKTWTPIGEISQGFNLGPFLRLVSDITGIDDDFLCGVIPFQRASIAQRMSWAAMRDTTREEDTAYSLMGIFDVNMPLLYGDGSKAFQRLQEEIMKHSDDHSLFAWTQKDALNRMHGLLADNTACFKTEQVFPDLWNPLDER